MQHSTFIAEYNRQIKVIAKCKLLGLLTHGAGRVMSRTRAFNELSLEEYKDSMDGIYSDSVTEDTLDEAKFAYKSEKLIRSAIGPTASIVHDLDPVINWKAK